MYSEPNDISKLQANLIVIRKIAGWSAETLGHKIGVTKQTICNLENHKTLMTLTQCIAIRSVLDDEIEQNPSNTLLKGVVELLLDSESMDEADEETQVEVDDVMQTLAAAASGGLGVDRLTSLAKKLLGGIVGLTATGVALGGLAAMLDDD